MPPNSNPRPGPEDKHAAAVLANLSNHLAAEYGVPPPGRTCRRGFPHLPCLLCGRRGSLAVVLADTRRIRCLGCGEEMALEAVKDVLGSWADVVEWVERAPPCEST